MSVDPWRAVDGQDSRQEVKGSMESGVLVLIVLAIRVVLNAINIDGAMTFVSTPNVDLARDGLAGAGRAA